MAYSITVPILLFFLYMGKNEVTPYKNVFILIFIGIACSIISCNIHRGQPILSSIKAIPNYFGILFYFFLKWKKVPLSIIEDTLVKLVVAFDVLYIAQFYLIDYGINFFGIEDWMLSEETEGNRIRVMSSGLYSIGMFYGIVNWYETKQNKYMLLFVLGVFIMLLAGYRQFILSLGISLVFMLYRFDHKLKLKHVGFVIACVAIAYIVMQIPAVQAKLAGMTERNDMGATLDNSDYIRVIQWEFFNNNFFQNNWEHFFGAGIPLVGSAYGKYFESLTDSGLQYVDWGIIGVSWMLGIMTAIGYLWMAIKAIRFRVDNRYMYISLWYIFLLTASITNWEFFRNGNFLVHAIALYIIELANQDHTEYENRILLEKS